MILLLDTRPRSIRFEYRDGRPRWIWPTVSRAPFRYFFPGLSVCEKKFANTVHELFMNCLQNSLRKLVCHRFWQTLFSKPMNYFQNSLRKASQSPTLANKVHEQFMNSFQKNLRKPVRHRLWQTCS